MHNCMSEGYVFYIFKIRDSGFLQNKALVSTSDSSSPRLFHKVWVLAQVHEPLRILSSVF